MINIDNHKVESWSSSQYILIITNKYKDGPLSSTQYTLTNIDNKDDNFAKEAVWLCLTNYSLLVTK